MGKIVELENENIERRALYFAISDQRYFRPLDPNIFGFGLHRKVQGVMNKFYSEFGVAPSIESLGQYPESDREVNLFLQEIASMGLDGSGWKPALDALYNMQMYRSILVESTTMVNGIRGHKDGKKLIQDAVTRLTSVKHPLVVGDIQRGWTHDEAVKAWEHYKEREAHPERFKDGIRYGLYYLDRYTNGGTRKGHITLIYGDTSSGKTRLKSNIAYNMSMLGKRVMYITIEDPLQNMARIWLSRASLLDSRDVENATLNPEHREVFRRTCERIHVDHNLPYIVFWTGTATSADLRREIVMYETAFGYYPDVVFFDYSNEAYPVRAFNGSSERYNFLFSEYRQLTSEFEIPLITSLQESRTGKQKKKESEFGLDSIGQSHYVAPHCHVVIYIKQEMDDILNVYLQKNRYGPRHKKFLLIANWSIGYLGDKGRLVTHDKFREILERDEAPIEEAEAAFAKAPVNHPNSPAADVEVDSQIGLVNQEDSFANYTSDEDSDLDVVED